MMGAVRAVSIEKGEDPAPLRFGGIRRGGPVARSGAWRRKMGMDTVVIPTRPGILSALGLLDADVRGDFSITRLAALTLENTAALRDGAVDLMARGAAWRAAERLNEDSVETSWTADLRYIGQAFELMAPILTRSGTPDFDEATLAALRAEFHRQHASINGYAMEGHAVEMVNLRLSVAAIRPSAGGVETLGDGADVEETIRPVWFPETGFVETPVRDRASVTPGPKDCRANDRRANGHDAGDPARRDRHRPTERRFDTPSWRDLRHDRRARPDHPRPDHDRSRIPPRFSGGGGNGHCADAHRPFRRISRNATIVRPPCSTHAATWWRRRNTSPFIWAR